MSATGYLLNSRDTYKPEFINDTDRILNDFDSSLIFHQQLPEYEPTPLINIRGLSKMLHVNNIWVKDEGSRFGTGALKILGASYAVNHFSKNVETHGICTATDGNHGRAVAWAAQKKGIKSVVFVPHYTSENRIKAIENEGAHVIVSKGEYDQAVKEAAFFAREKQFKLIQDTAWKEYLDVPAYITAGYYTQMHEICNETDNLKSPEINIVIVQAGVGSWPSAVVHYIRKKLNNDSIKIICVEPYESDCIYESIKSDKLVPTKKSQKTIMAGLNCGTPSLLAFEILRQGIDAFLLISDQYTVDAVKYLNAPLPGDDYIAAGESGASGLAGLIAIISNPELKKLKETLGINEKSNILVFNTEGVTDPDLTQSILNETF